MNIAPERLRSGLFRDRREAGRLLAKKLSSYANRSDVIVLALPRGGVPVAHEVARALGAPLGGFADNALGIRRGPGGCRARKTERAWRNRRAGR